MSQQELRRLDALVARWQAEREDRAYRLKLKTRFAKATTLDLITMWATGANETGKRLTTFEVEALVEAWLRVFGELPPPLAQKKAPRSGGLEARPHPTRDQEERGWVAS